jgi:hypothetical protein
MTKEAKIERATERAAKKDALALKYPGAFWQFSRSGIHMNDGEPWVELFFSAPIRGDDEKGQIRRLMPVNLEQMRSVIIAMICRYNGAVEELNGIEVPKMADGTRI